MTYAIDFPGITTLPIAESTQTFPVGRIYCVGRNYAEHAKEMGHDPDRTDEAGVNASELLANPF